MIEKMPVPLFENSTFEMRNIIIIINQIYHNLFALNACYVCCEWCSFSLRHCLPITARGSQDISLDKASFPSTQCGNKYPTKDKRNPVFGHFLSKTILLFQNRSKIRNVKVHWPPCFNLNNVSAVSLCVFVSLAKTSRVHRSVRHPIVESANKRLF